MHRPVNAIAPLCVAVVVVAVASSTSCKGGVVALCEERARLRCEIAFACCSSEERPFFVREVYVDDEDECIERATAICTLAGAASDDSVVLGRTGFNDVQAEECLENLRAAAEACDVGSAQRAQLLCDDVTEGTVTGGGECAFSSECRAGGTCDLESPPDVDDALHAPLGACVEPPAQGDECPEGVCATGLFCQNNRCDVLPGDGDPCNVECAPGLFCALTEFVCAAQKVDGERCDSPVECLGGICQFVPASNDEFPRCGGVAPGQCGG